MSPTIGYHLPSMEEVVQIESRLTPDCEQVLIRARDIARLRGGDLRPSDVLLGLALLNASDPIHDALEAPGLSPLVIAEAIGLPGEDVAGIQTRRVDGSSAQGQVTNELLRRAMSAALIDGCNMILPRHVLSAVVEASDPLVNDLLAEAKVSRERLIIQPPKPRLSARYEGYPRTSASTDVWRHVR
jgi:hypothetical protein